MKDARGHGSNGKGGPAKFTPAYMRALDAALRKPSPWFGARIVMRPSNKNQRTHAPSYMMVGARG